MNKKTKAREELYAMHIELWKYARQAHNTEVFAEAIRQFMVVDKKWYYSMHGHHRGVLTAEVLEKLIACLNKALPLFKKYDGEERRTALWKLYESYLVIVRRIDDSVNFDHYLNMMKFEFGECQTQTLGDA